MSACKPGCRCSCGQIGCGCHEQGRPVFVPRSPENVCKECGSELLVSNVASPGGVVVVVGKCPTCDRPRS